MKNNTMTKKHLMAFLTAGALILPAVALSTQAEEENRTEFLQSGETALEEPSVETEPLSKLSDSLYDQSSSDFILGEEKESELIASDIQANEDIQSLTPKETNVDINQNQLEDLNSTQELDITTDLEREDSVLNLIGSKAQIDELAQSISDTTDAILTANESETSLESMSADIQTEGLSEKVTSTP